MAFTNKFQVYAENGSNVYGDEAYASDTERSNGSVAATPISSKLMNTALKTASLISVAVIDALVNVSGSQSGSAGLSDTKAQLTQTIANLLLGAIMSVKDTGITASSTDDKLATPKAVWSAIQDPAKVKTAFSIDGWSDELFSRTLNDNPEATANAWYSVYSDVAGNFGTIYIPRGATNTILKINKEGNVEYGLKYYNGRLCIVNMSAQSTYLDSRGILIKHQ